jgi:HK97 gp10 family phage protein
MTVTMPEELMAKVSKLADRTDTVVAGMLEDGGRVVLAKVRDNLLSVLGRTKYPSRSTGQLAASLGLSSAKVDRKGNMNVKIGFSEPRRVNVAQPRTVSNAMLANILEHGKHGQPPRPFMKPARAASKSAVIAAMSDRLEKEINRL